jgi:hypothetical protein
VKFESEKVTDIVIDQDTLDLTCINGPQWFERDFKEGAQNLETPARIKPKELRNVERAKLRKKPDPVNDTPDMNASLAGVLLQRMGLLPGNENP